MSEPSASPEAELPFVPLRLYPKLAQAREAALALAAREILHRIDRRGELWSLSAEAPAAGLAEEELAAFEAEQQAPAAQVEPRAFLPFHPWSLLLAGALLAGAFLVQQYWPLASQRGNAASDEIVRHGEWWRCFTALFLHADLGHLLANLGFGLLFAGFLISQYGAGAAWLLTLLAGALGNAINAWGYRGEAHHSIGASTGVFAALGLLAGSELYARWALPSTRTRRHLIAPLGAGLALLAILGVGEEHGRIDFMAHAWGFLAGLLLALPAAATTLRRPPPAWSQPAAGTLALALIALAWWLALRGALG